MKNFFQTRKFKALVGIVLILAGFMAYAGISGNLATLPEKVVAGVSIPFQKITSGIAKGAAGFIQSFTKYGETQKENESLKQQIAQLESQLLELEQYKAENQQLREFYDIQEQNPEWSMVSAVVVGRDPLAQFYSFTIDKGTLSGIQKGNTVIDGNGSLVGLVVETGPNFARVETILDPSISAAALISRTRDNGLATGNKEFAPLGKCTLIHLDKDSKAVVGDKVITTGMGGVFPKNLPIGTLEQLTFDASGKSLIAVLNPDADIQSVRSVMVITNVNE